MLASPSPRCLACGHRPAYHVPADYVELEMRREVHGPFIRRPWYAGSCGAEVDALGRVMLPSKHRRGRRCGCFAHVTDPAVRRAVDERLATIAAERAEVDAIFERLLSV